MTSIERFEDLFAWQKARTLAREVCGAAAHGSFAKDFGLRDQANRAAASVAANIAEGFERGGRPEFHQFLSIAKGSSGELRSHLYLALDRGHLDAVEFNRLKELADEVARLVSGLRTAVARQRDAELKDKEERSRHQ